MKDFDTYPEPVRTSYLAYLKAGRSLKSGATALQAEFHAACIEAGVAPSRVASDYGRSAGCEMDKRRGGKRW